MGTNYYLVKSKPTTREPIHIGKSSIGWRFLFHRVNEPWNDPPVVWNTYNQVKSFLQKYAVLNKDYLIMDEYDEIVSYEDFVRMVDRKQKEDNPHNFENADDIDGYRFTDAEFS